MSEHPIYVVPNDGPPYDWSPTSYDKGMDLLKTPDAVLPVDEHTWSVQGSRPYVVRRQGPWLTCSCPNGQALGGNAKCYHTAAVFQILDGDLILQGTGKWD